MIDVFQAPCPQFYGACLENCQDAMLVMEYLEVRPHTQNTAVSSASCSLLFVHVVCAVHRSSDMLPAKDTMQCLHREATCGRH